MKYCLISTQSHLIAKTLSCLESFNILFEREGYTGEALFDPSDLCMDLDKAENNLASKEKRLAKKSMDLGFCVKVNDQYTVILTELKLNCENPNNLKKPDLIEKIDYSKELIEKCCTKTKCYSVHYYIFNPLFVQEAKNRLARYVPAFPHTWKVLDSIQFQKLFFKNDEKNNNN